MFKKGAKTTSDSIYKNKVELFSYQNKIKNLQNDYQRMVFRVKLLNYDKNYV